MNLVRRSFLVVLFTLFVGSGTSFGQGRIQLVQGRRAIKDNLTFTVDVLRDKNESPRYATAPEDIQVYLAISDRPASGFVYLDGKALGRFDETVQFNSNLADITYGKHTITVKVSSPALLGQLVVTVRGARVQEVMDSEAEVSVPVTMEKRVAELEKKVQDLESEVASLKKKRNH
jgi:hypothetical protein